MQVLVPQTNQPTWINTNPGLSIPSRFLVESGPGKKALQPACFGAFKETILSKGLKLRFSKIQQDLLYR